MNPESYEQALARNKALNAELESLQNLARSLNITSDFEFERANNYSVLDALDIQDGTSWCCTSTTCSHHLKACRFLFMSVLNPPAFQQLDAENTGFLKKEDFPLLADALGEALDDSELKEAYDLMTILPDGVALSVWCTVSRTIALFFFVGFTGLFAGMHQIFSRGKKGQDR